MRKLLRRMIAPGRRSGRGGVWGAVFLLACLLGGTVALAKPAPNLKFRDMAGHAVRLESLRGHVAVVNFWATWCGPCKQELPRLSALRAAYAKQGVEFVAISVDEPKDFAQIQPYFKQHQITLPVWTGANLGTLGRLGFGNVVPATLVLDAQGDVVGRIEGEARDADVRGYLDWLLRGRQGKAPPKRIRRY
jgi:thiol-disulfide isomerase/thioredoxin